MERKGLLLAIDRNNDGMSSIVSASAPGADVDVRSEDVYEFSFALIAPLRTQNNRH